MASLKRPRSPTVSDLLTGSGCLLVLAAIYFDLRRSKRYFAIQNEYPDPAEAEFALHRIGELFGSHPLLAVPFVLGIGGVAVGSVLCFIDRWRGGAVLTGGFGFVTLTLIASYAFGWPYVMGGPWGPFLLPGVCLVNLGLTVDRDAAWRPFVILGAAFALAIIGLILLMDAMSASPQQSVGFLAVAVWLVLVFGSVTRIERIDSGVTAAGVIVATAVGALLVSVFPFDPDSYGAGTSPILVAVVLAGMVVALSSLLIEQYVSDDPISNQSVQWFWGLVCLSGWYYMFAGEAVYRLGYYFIPERIFTGLEKQLWKPLTAAALFVFVLSLISATWLTYRSELSIRSQ